jgi:hypothetical protein
MNETTGATEIVKNFKFLLRASPLGYRGVQVFEHKQWPSDLVSMERWGERERGINYFQ